VLCNSHGFTLGLATSCVERLLQDPSFFPLASFLSRLRFLVGASSEDGFFQHMLVPAPPRSASGPRMLLGLISFKIGKVGCGYCGSSRSGPEIGQRSRGSEFELAWPLSLHANRKSLISKTPESPDGVASTTMPISFFLRIS